MKQSMLFLSERLIKDSLCLLHSPLTFVRHKQGACRETISIVTALRTSIILMQAEISNILLLVGWLEPRILCPSRTLMLLP